MSKKSKNKQKKEKSKVKDNTYKGNTKEDYKPSNTKNHSSACNCRYCQEEKEDKKGKTSTGGNNKGGSGSKNEPKKNNVKYTSSYTPAAPCHEGNVLVFEKDGVKVYAGGDSRKANPNSVDIVLDLASNIRKKWDIPSGWSSAKYMSGPSQVVDMHISDYTAPNGVTKEFWSALWADLKKQAPVSVLAFCQGGHGRTGLVITCLMMASKMKTYGKENPITWLRDKYCEKAVESQSQLSYLGDMYEIPYVKESKPSYYSGGSSNQNLLGGGYKGSSTSSGYKVKCHNGCGSEGGDVVYSGDIKRNECDVCFNKRQKKKYDKCECTNASVCKSCSEDGVKCSNQLCVNSTEYTCKDCEAAEDEEEDKEGDGDVSIHSLTDDAYEELEQSYT